MERYPADMMDFMDMFPTEEACLEYLSLIRWRDGYKCTRCGSNAYWKTARYLYHCKACHYESSVTAGTLFEGTRKPLRLWFLAIWYVANQKNGVSASGACITRALALLSG